MLPRRRGSKTKLDEMSDEEEEFNIYDKLIGANNEDFKDEISTDEINELIRKPQQRRASLSKTKGDHLAAGSKSIIDSISEGLASSVDSNKIKFMWLSLIGLFSIIGLLAVLNSKSARSFSFSSLTKSVDGKLAIVDSERTPTDMLFFWHLPRSAGTTFQIIASKCLGFVLAAEYGGAIGADNQRLRVVDLAKPKGKFVNVDVTTISGLKRAKRLGLAQSRLADLIYSEKFQHAADLFDVKYQGRAFTFMRDPIERCLSLYQSLSSRKSFQMTLGEFAQSDLVIDNYMVRELTGKENAKLDERDLSIAKEILGKRVVIGLTTDPAGSFKRFQNFFGWKLSSSQEKCVNELLLKDWAKKGNQLQVMGGDKSMQLLKNVNEYDMELYAFAKELYQHQGRLIS